MPRFAKVTLAAAVLALAPVPVAAAQQAGDNWSQPYGMAQGDENRPYAGQRGRGGNRVIINGIIQTGAGVSAQGTITGSTGGGVGNSRQYLGSSATAIANQLNVVVNGNYNTVVVNSRQTNTGDIIANANSSGGQPQTGGPSFANAGTSLTGMQSAGSVIGTLPQANAPSSASHSTETPQ